MQGFIEVPVTGHGNVLVSVNHIIEVRHSSPTQSILVMQVTDPEFVIYADVPYNTVKILIKDAQGK